MFKAAIGDAVLGFILPSQRARTQDGHAGPLARLHYPGIQVEIRSLPMGHLQWCHGDLFSLFYDVTQVAPVR